MLEEGFSIKLQALKGEERRKTKIEEKKDETSARKLTARAGSPPPICMIYAAITNGKNSDVCLENNRLHERCLSRTRVETGGRFRGQLRRVPCFSKAVINRPRYLRL